MVRQALSIRLLSFILMTIALWAGPAVARQNISATLVAESATPASGSVVMLALDMRPKPGWHGYWINPGDAGFGARLDWSLPEGATFGPVRFPVPERLIISGLMNHVYNGDHALLVPLRIPAGLAPGTRFPIRLKGEWLACTDKVCVPERAELSLDLTIGDGAISAERRAQFDAWRAKLPRPLGSPARFERARDMIRIGIPYPATLAADDPWFFTATEGVIAYAAPQSVRRAGDLLIIEARANGPTPPSIEGILSVGSTGLEVRATPGAVPAARNDTGLLSILAALGGALLGGLLLNIMPCVFPIISLKAISLARAGGSEAAARRDALAYTAGVVVTCLSLGALLLGLRAAGQSVGWAFQLQSPWVLGVLFILAVTITLNLLGLFELRSFGGGQALTEKGGAAGSFWTGVLAAFVATPCTGPFMAAALGAALVLPTAVALTIFAGLGLGMALPFLAIGYVPSLRSRLPRPGPWMVTFRRWMALPMALTAAALAWLLWPHVSGTASDRGSAVAAEGAERFSEMRLSELRKAGRPVFLYFTADWCVTCKVNEAAAIHRSETRAAFQKAGVVTLVGDWTAGDPAITRFLERRGRSGVPLYLWYPKGGGEPTELPQVLTKDGLVALVR